LTALKSAIAGDIFVDFRNLFDPEVVAQAGLAYHSVGRPVTMPRV
jgi:UDPglucose 6-dehydrogenase